MSERTWYHGTTEEKLRVLMSRGLRKGSFVSSEQSVAEEFALERSRFNGERPVIVSGEQRISKYRRDRSGRLEATLLADCCALTVVKRL
jgi:hypothetical protein